MEYKEDTTDQTVRKEPGRFGGQHPLLGTPVRMFEDDQIFVVNEPAKLGRTYGFICPVCHSYFISTADCEDVKRESCPECGTVVCFHSEREDINPRPTANPHATQVATHTLLQTMEAVLVWEQDGKTKSLLLGCKTYIIGRKDDVQHSDIELPDPTASRRSVRIEVSKGEQTGNYSFKLTVMKTTNAVFVNNNMLYDGDCVYLNYGDILKIGETTMLFKDAK